MVGDLQRGRAGELVRLAGDEAVEGERRIEARRLRASRYGGGAPQGPQGSGDRHDGRRGRRCGGLAGGGLGRATGVAWRGNDELDAEVIARGVAEHRRYPGAEAVLHPLQDEAIRGHQPNPVRGRLAAQRTDPGRELLRSQVPLEGGRGRPTRGRRRSWRGWSGFPRQRQGGVRWRRALLLVEGKKGDRHARDGYSGTPSYAHSRGRAPGYPQAISDPAWTIESRREPVRARRE